MQTYSISILTDKALYSHKIAQKETVWLRIRRVKDIPPVCNDFERDIIITFAHIAPDPSFFTARYRRHSIISPPIFVLFLLDGEAIQIKREVGLEFSVSGTKALNYR